MATFTGKAAPGWSRTNPDLERDVPAELRMDFPERDWKHLRAVHPVALARYCERVLAEAAAIIADDRVPAHERYVGLARAIGYHSRQMAGAFDDMRRSRAIERLASLVRLQLLTDAELAQFSPDVRASAVALNDLLTTTSVDPPE